MRNNSYTESNIFCDALVYKEYPYRLVLFFLYYTLLAASQTTLTTYSAALPLFTDPNRKFTYSNQELILFSGIYPFMLTLFTFPAIHLIQKISNNATIIRIACLVLTLGSILKIFSYVSPAIIVIGQMLCSFGVILIGKSSVKITYNWWAISKCDIVTQVKETSTIIGYSLGFTLPGFFILNKWQPKTYLLVESAIMIFFSILSFGLFKDKPRTPPSKFSDYRMPEIVASIKSYFKIRNFTLIFLCYSLTYGTSLVLLIYIPLVISNFDFDIGPYDVFCGISLIAGFILSFLFAILKGKYKDPLLLNLLKISAFIASTCLLTYGLVTGQALMLYAGTLFSVCFLTPLPSFLISTLTDTGAELHETLVSGILTTGGSLYCLIMGVILLKACEGDKAYSFYALTIAPISLLLCMILLLFIKK